MANSITHERSTSDPPIARFLFSDVRWRSVACRPILGTPWRVNEDKDPAAPRQRRPRQSDVTSTS